jgi:signal transduction histidine kinase
MRHLLERTLGEYISLNIVRSSTLSTFIDPEQFGSAIFNLCINSRDAMPRGGRLTIETRNASFDEAHPNTGVEWPRGEYVMVAESDTSSGMPSEVAARF